ncbi:MAG: acyltransferase [Verrucomicrobiota bacterium]
MNLRSLDALRGLLATYVLLGHSRWLLWAGHEEWSRHAHALLEKIIVYASALLRYGHEAVTVFFVLSGFFIHLRFAQSSADKRQEEFQWSRFFQRRLHRLLPPYWLALGLTVVLDAIGRHFCSALYNGTTGNTLLDLNFAQTGFSSGAVLPALLMLPKSLGIGFGSNGPLWSLAFEVVYYLLYPAWLGLRRLNAVAAYLAAPLIGFGALLLPQVTFISAVLQYYPVWIAGAALAEILCRPGKSLLALACPLGVGIFAWIGFRLVPSNAWVLLGSASAGFIAVLLFARLPSGICNFRVHRIAEQVGLRSYSLYICHFPILCLMSAWLMATQGSRPVNGAIALTGAMVAFALSLGCFEMCEKRFLHRSLPFGGGA